jgi:hypothetical protein
MSLIQHEVSARKVAANQANAQKSSGPKTPQGKARAALNALRHGAYARAENRRREVMLGRGQDPAEYEQVQADLVKSWQPEDAMQALLVQTLGEKIWEKLQWRQAWLDAQSAALHWEQTQGQRRQLAARRWPRGARPGVSRGLCGAHDSPHKFDQILQLLGCLQEWCDSETCPDEYPEVMDRLYGDLPTLAGERIKELFLQLFDDDEAVCERARQELPKRIVQERSDVEQDRELCYREVSLKAKSGALSEEKVAAKEAVLERQISEQTRLLTHLKSKRSLWGLEPEAEEALSSGAGSTEEGEDKKNGSKRANEANISPEISNLTEKTNPNEANKSFVLGVPPGNEPKPSQQVL